MAGEPVCPLCHSRFCFVRSAEVCITLHQRRDAGAKGLEKPARDTAVKAAKVTK